jgi:hypothetical protein
VLSTLLVRFGVRIGRPVSRKSNAALHTVNWRDTPLVDNPSVGGFNPLFEQNVKSRLPRPFHLDPFEEGRLEEEEEDNDLSDLEERESVGKEKAKKSFWSLVGTLAKGFMRKRDRGGKSTKVMKEEVKTVGVEMWSTKGKRKKNSSTGSKKRKATE